MASGLTENIETTIAETVLPTVRNASNLAVYLEGKLKMNTTQALPAGSPADATLGCVQFSNNTTSVGKVKIKGVKGPFYLKIYQTSANASEGRNLRVTIDGTEVYYNGGVGSTLYTCEYNYTGTGTVDVEAYGWDGTQGKGDGMNDKGI